MGRVDDLVAFCEAGDGLAELLLLEGVQAETGFVEKEDGVAEVVLRLRVEDDEEGDEPPEAFAALVEFDGDTEFVLDERLEVLAVHVEPECEAPRRSRPSGSPRSGVPQRS